MCGEAGINIENMLSKSRGDWAYTILDVTGDVTEDVREKRFRDACEEMTMDELRAIVYDANPDMLRAVARERIEELESIERYKAEQKQKEEERRAKRKKLFSGILGRDEDDGKPPKNRPPEF